MNRVLYLCSIMLLFTSWNCSKKENGPTGPDAPNYDVVFSDSFEENGTGALQGWTYVDSAYAGFLSFSTDVPNTDSKYSLCIDNDSVNGPYIYRILRNPSPSEQRDVVLDFWVKGEGGTLLSVDFAFYGSTYGFSLLLNTESRWGHVVDTLHDEQNPQTPKFDSLKVLIGGVNYYPDLHKIFLDNFRIIELTGQ